MSVGVTTQVVGAKETIRALNKIEHGLRKQFAAQATQIAQPAITEAQNRYQRIGWGVDRLHGVSYRWTQGGSQKFPFNVAKAMKGVKIKLEGDRRRTAVILIEQRDAGTAILESAGRKTSNRLGNALGSLKPNHSRILGPSLFAKKDQVQGALEKEMIAVVNRVQREI